MSKWIDVAAVAEVPAGQRKCARAEGIPVTLFNIEGKYLAIQNICPHAGLPLGEGDLQGVVLTCPFHGFAYNIQTGMNVDFGGDVPLRTYPVRAENERLLIDLQPASTPAA